MNTTEHGLCRRAAVLTGCMEINRETFCSIFGVVISVKHRHLTPIIEMVPKSGKNTYDRVFVIQWPATQ